MRLDYPEFGADAKQVLERLVPIEREVGLPGGNWFLARLLRTERSRIASVALVASFIDITERKQAEEVRLWLSAVVASSLDAIMSFSMDQTLSIAGAERMFGYTAAEDFGQPRACSRRDRRSRRPNCWTRCAAARREQQRRGAASTAWSIHVSLSISPGKVIGGTAIARDITQQKQAATVPSEERLRLVVENATDLLDRHGAARPPPGIQARSGCWATPRTK